MCTVHGDLARSTKRPLWSSLSNEAQGMYMETKRPVVLLVSFLSLLAMELLELALALSECFSEMSGHPSWCKKLWDVEKVTAGVKPFIKKAILCSEGWTRPCKQRPGRWAKC
jgi:hypothetical protein